MYRRNQLLGLAALAILLSVAWVLINPSYGVKVAKGENPFPKAKKSEAIVEKHEPEMIPMKYKNPVLQAKYEYALRLHRRLKNVHRSLADLAVEGERFDAALAQVEIDRKPIDENIQKFGSAYELNPFEQEVVKQANENEQKAYGSYRAVLTRLEITKE